MVYDLPKVLVSHIYGYVTAVPAADQIFATIIECYKGTPNTPILVNTPQQLAQEYGVSLDAYWGVGGQPVWVTRAVHQGDYDEELEEYETPVTKSVHYLWDTSATSTPIIKIEALKEGSYTIYLDAGPNPNDGNDIVLEEENCPSEYFIGVHQQLTEPEKPAIQRLVEQINDDSFIVKAYYRVATIASPYTERWCDGSDFDSELEEVVAGSDELELTGRIKLGSTGGVSPYENSIGSDGELKVPSERRIFNIVPDALAAEAYRNALVSIESLRIAGVFVMSGVDAVYGEVAAHVTKMNTAEEHGWRIGIVGADEENPTMMGMIADAIDLNSENMIFVGQGVVDINGTEYPSRMATQVVAGKIGYTPYQYAIWGGNPSKILAAQDVKYIGDILPIPGSSPTDTATRNDLRMYNEHGVLTFRKDDDGVRIREGITTAQNTNYFDEDEIAVERIVRHAKYQVYDKCYEALGENISNTFKKDLESALKAVLGQMQEEGALIDVPTDGLTAYKVSVGITPRAMQREGRVIVDIAITPVHAARIISARITVF